MLDSMCPISRAVIDEFTEILRTKFPPNMEIGSLFHVYPPLESPYPDLPDSPAMEGMRFTLFWKGVKGEWIEYSFDILEWKMEEFITYPDRLGTFVEPILKIIKGRG